MGGTITIQALSEQTGGAFDAVVSFDEGGEHAVRVMDPAADDRKGEELLSWYFEEHLRFPFLDHDRERAAVAYLQAYGRDLFAQVLGETTRCNDEYRRRRDVGFDGCRVEIVGSPAFHRLHWEALTDPQVAEPLAVRVPILRRLGVLGAGFDLRGDSPTLNILVVTARPAGANDVGHRTISRPLLDAVRRARIPVAIDLVRPGTWASLCEHLRLATSRHGSGWYQVVHFDVHGAVGRFPSSNRGGPASHDILAAHGPPLDDAAAVLFFETTVDGVAEPVPAAAVASLLAEHRVPIAVLNACQSASPAGAEANLAGHLVKAGVRAAVGMAYSVTVSAAEAMMPVLYEHLVDGADLVTATHHARRRLFDHRTRRAYFDHEIALDDWVLPVLFWQRPVHTKLRQLEPAEEAAFYERQAAVAAEPQPTYGFVGRDLDVQAIERRLLVADDTNELLVRGMAGAGKSTLLKHLAWWWQRTGLVDRTFSFTYEQRAWTTGQITHALSNVLLDQTERERLASLPDEAQTERVASALRADRHLLVIDNAESITGSPAAIPHVLDEPEQQRLRSFLASLRGGRTLVLIGSRTDERWMAPGCFGANVHELGGLDPQAVSVLVERVLEAHGGTHHLDDPAEAKAMQDLVDMLDGFPLALTVLLPRLAHIPPSSMLTDLRRGDPGSDPTNTIRRAIEYSHSRLNPELQDALLLLAPFTNVVPTAPLDYYQYLIASELGGDAATSLDLRAALDEAIATGLAASDSHLPEHIRLQPVLPYFLRMRLADRPALATAIANAHFALYSELADRLYKQLVHTSAKERAAGQAQAQAEHANLATALEHGLAAGMSVTRLIWILDEQLEQNAQPDVRREFLERLVATVGDPTSTGQREQLAVLHHLAGNTCRQLNELDQALNHYYAEINLREQLGDRKGLGATHHQLGLIAHKRRHFAEAERHYRTALDSYVEFGQQREQAGSHHQLGLLAQEERRFADADRHYHEALDIYLKLGERRETAGVRHQLGVVAAAQENWAKAETQYRQALWLCEEFGELGAAAGAWHNLGTVAQQQGRLVDAEDHYRAALELRLRLDDRRGSAVTYHQLGSVARAQERLDEAERYLRKALEIKLEAGDRFDAATTYDSLGGVAADRRDFDQAEQLLGTALDIRRQHDDAHGTAISCFNLADTRMLHLEADGMPADGLTSLRDPLQHVASLYVEARDLFSEVGDNQRAALSRSRLDAVTAMIEALPPPPSRPS